MTLLTVQVRGHARGKQTSRCNRQRAAQIDLRPSAQMPQLHRLNRGWRRKKLTHAGNGSAVQHAQAILTRGPTPNRQSKTRNRGHSWGGWATPPPLPRAESETHRVLVGHVQLNGHAAGRCGCDAQLRRGRRAPLR